MLAQIERLVYSLLGSTRSDTRPLIYALNMIIHLHLEQHISRSEIPVTKTIYPQVAQQLNRSVGATSRSVERLANLCWDEACRQGRLMELFGRERMDIPSASGVLFYLSYLIYYGKPFFVLFDDQGSNLPSA